MPGNRRLDQLNARALYANVSMPRAGLGRASCTPAIAAAKSPRINNRHASTTAAPMTITIWHNPKCGTSRNVLAMVRATGVEPTVVEYLKTPPDAVTLARVAAAVGGAAKLMRAKGTPAEQLGLDKPGTSDAVILAAMAEHPILINRPVVIAPRGTILARPSERVLAVLDGSLPPGFLKEDGKPATRP